MTNKQQEHHPTDSSLLHNNILIYLLILIIKYCLFLFSTNIPIIPVVTVIYYLREREYIERTRTYSATHENFTGVVCCCLVFLLNCVIMWPTLINGGITLWN